VTTREVGLKSVHQVPTDARLCESLGGARVSLNNRVLRRILETADSHQFDAPTIDADFTELLQQGQILVYDRTPMDDEAVTNHIMTRLRGSTDESRLPSKTHLLRQLRDNGYACEQSRFGHLYGKSVERLRAEQEPQ
jgi:hypothetical protein